ncbi:hypothetical protein ES703_92944 [subsurface metagenome]
MDIAVRVGRPIVKYIRSSATAGLSDFGIDILPRPVFANLRLTLNKIGLHRKARLRQAQSISIAFSFLVRHLKILKNTNRTCKLRILSTNVNIKTRFVTLRHHRNTTQIF